MGGPSVSSLGGGGGGGGSGEAGEYMSLCMIVWQKIGAEPHTGVHSLFFAKTCSP